jgi:hypothetical protein
VFSGPFSTGTGKESIPHEEFRLFSIRPEFNHNGARVIRILVLKVFNKIKNLGVRPTKASNKKFCPQYRKW